MQYPSHGDQSSPLHSQPTSEAHLSAHAIPSQHRAQGNPPPSYPQPPHPQPSLSSSAQPHAYPYPEYARPYHGRGGFFAPWFQPPHVAPPPPPPAGPLHPHYPYSTPHQSHPYPYRFYRRCGRGRCFLPLLIVGGVGYWGYRKLNAKIDGVRAEAARADNPLPMSPTDDQGTARARRWGWHHHHDRRFEKAEDEQRRAEAERGQNDFETKMKEWQAAIGRDKAAKQEEQSRWI